MADDVIEIEISDGESIFWQDDDTLNDAPDGNIELQIMYVLLLQNQIQLNMSLMDFLFRIYMKDTEVDDVFLIINIKMKKEKKPSCYCVDICFFM